MLQNSTYAQIASKTTTPTELLVLRGIYGSGKTELANAIAEGKIWKDTSNRKWTVVSADHFFMEKDEGGNVLPETFAFCPGGTQLAHDACYKAALDSIKKGFNVILDNTNCRVRDFQRYLEIPHVKVKILVLTTEHKSVKNIPAFAYQKYREHYQPHPEERYVMLDKLSWWLVETFAPVYARKH